MSELKEAFNDAAALFAGVGEVRSLARELDWSTSQLGPTTGWTPALRTMARSIFDSPFPICLWSGPQYALVYNDAYRRILAAKHPAALGQPGAVVWAEIWEELDPQFEGVRLKGEAVYFEDAPFVMARLDGGGTETAWFNYSLSALRDEDGSVAAVLNITPETSARVLLEQRLEQEQAALVMSEERLRLVVEGAKDHVIFTTDPGGIITTWAAGAQAVLGWTADEALGQSASMIFTKEDRATGADVRELAGAARDGSANDERWHLRKDGSRVFLNGSVHPLPVDGDGRERGFIKVARDETARYEADRRLEHETERQRLSLQQMPGFVAILSGPDHVFDYVNDAYVAITGQRDFIGRSVRDALPDLAGQGFYELLDGVFATGKPFSGKALPLSLSNASQLLYVDLAYQPIRSDGGEVIGIFVGGYDVTDRVRAEQRREALLQLDIRLRDAADAAGLSYAAAELLGETLNADRVGYGAIDAEAGTLTVERNWNAPGFADVSGVHQFSDYGSYFEDTRTGKFVAIPDVTTDPRVRGQADALLKLDIRALLDVPVVERGLTVGQFFVHSGGVRQWTAEEVGLVREFGERTRVATARRDAEERLRGSEARLANALASANLGTFEWNIVTGRVELDAQARAVFDLPTDTAVNVSDIFARIVPDQVEEVRDAAFALAESRRRFEFEYDIDLPGGGRRSIRSSGVAVDAVGDIHVVGVFQDATELKAAERAMQDLNETLEARVTERTRALEVAHEQLRQSQKMEAVGQLTGGLAHDFNNLLTAVTGGLELLGHRLAAGQYDRVDRYMSMALTGAQRAAALTQRLLAFSRRQTLAPVPTDADRLVAGMIEIIDRTLGPSIELHVAATAELWPVLVDAPQLENALLNLCLNARDAMPDGGRLTIETANKALDRRAAADRDLPEGDYVSLCVTDTGTGMTPEIIERVFDPFFTTKPLGEGTGLGLSMIYGFVRQSGGQIRVYSEVGQGTTMCLYLPRLVGEHDLRDAEQGQTVRHRAEQGQTVLLVEDEIAIRELVEEVLTEAGYRVLTAGNGPLGVALLRSDERIDLLVTDVGLPGGLNGRQVADAGRVVRPKLKVLFVTGYAANAAVGAGHLEDGMAVLTKPFNVLDLERRVGEILAT